jgi:hypothetical protein
MTKGALSSRLGRLNKQLRRLEDRLAFPKQSEELRLQWGEETEAYSKLPGHLFFTCSLQAMASAVN